MKKRLHTILLALLISIGVQAQHAKILYEGMVINEVTGEVVENALVEIDGTPYRVLTDKEGMFSFHESLPNAILTVVITKDNFKNHEFLLEVREGSDIPASFIEIHPGKSKKRKRKNKIVQFDETVTPEVVTNDKPEVKVPEMKVPEVKAPKVKVPEVKVSDSNTGVDVAVTVDESQTGAAEPEKGVEPKPASSSEGEIGDVHNDVVSFVGLDIPSSPDAPVASVAKSVPERYASILGVELENITNEPLYSFIDEWMKVPYYMGGETKYGVDCSSFSQKLYVSVYGQLIERTAAKQFNSIKMVRFTGVEYLQEGDLIFFKGANQYENSIVHVGIYLQNNKFVHATANKEGSGKGEVKISDLTKAFWTSRFVCAGRREIAEK